MKFNFPMSFSTTLLCWSLLEFPEAYNKSGQLDYMYDSIRWPLEYFVKCHTADNELYVQVKKTKQKKQKKRRAGKVRSSIRTVMLNFKSVFSTTYLT